MSRKLIDFNTLLDFGNLRAKLIDLLNESIADATINDANATAFVDWMNENFPAKVNRVQQTLMDQNARLAE